MKGKKSWIHRAQSRRNEESDLDDKFKIIRILKEKFGLHGLTGEKIPIDSQSFRCPDIYIKGLDPIIIELDGQIHGEPLILTQKTKDRNADYDKIGIKYIIINKEETGMYSENKVIQCLIENGLNPRAVIPYH